MPDFFRPENCQVVDRWNHEISVLADCRPGGAEVLLDIDDDINGIRSSLSPAQARQLIGALEWATDQVEREQ